MSKNITKIAIIGAGITGLSLGWYLLKNAKQPIELTIFEQDERAGGWIHSHQQEGFLFEKGPRSCLARGNGIETLKLVQELKLEKEVIIADSAAHQRYLYVDGRLNKLPNSGFELLQSMWLWPAIPGLIKDLFTKGAGAEDPEESIDQFARRRFNDFVADYLFDPMVSGIYAGDSKQISLKAAFPSLYEIEKKHGSLIWGFAKNPKVELPQDEFIQKIYQGRLFSFKNGMETLTKTLANKLESHLKLSCAVHSIKIKDGLVGIHHEQKISYVDHVYCTLPISQAKGLFHSYSDNLAARIPEIPMNSLAVINLGYEEDFDLNGFGHLVPSKENEKILGVTWDSSAFPDQNKRPVETRLTVMIGNKQDSIAEFASQDQLVNIALEGLWKQLGISQIPKTISVKIAKNAIPQYMIGHEDKINTFKLYLKRHLPQVTLLGSSINGVSVNDCIASAKKASEEFASEHVFAMK